MNIQAMMKQAQTLQKDIMKIKEKIDVTEFFGESSLVKVSVLGSKKITKVEIRDKESLDLDDLEVLEDMIVVAINDAMNKIDAALEQKMSKFGNIPGLF